MIANKLLYEDGLLNDEYYEKVKLNERAIESIIDYDRDYHFDYFALTTLTRAYLLKYENKIVIDNIILLMSVTNKLSKLFIDKNPPEEIIVKEKL